MFPRLKTASHQCNAYSAGSRRVVPPTISSRTAPASPQRHPFMVTFGALRESGGRCADVEFIYMEQRRKVPRLRDGRSSAPPCYRASSSSTPRSGQRRESLFQGAINARRAVTHVPGVEAPPARPSRYRAPLQKSRPDPPGKRITGGRRALPRGVTAPVFQNIFLAATPSPRFRAEARFR